MAGYGGSFGLILFFRFCCKTAKALHVFYNNTKILYAFFK
jgi:hypothetical protein